jgi:hypothetical protein
MTLYTQCARKYFYKKVAQYKVDSDVTEDTEAMMVGKCLHKIFEDHKHELAGLAYDTVKAAVAAHALEDELTPMVFAMCGAYKQSHEKSGLKAVACEHVIDTPEFYGIVDMVLADDSGWWIGDLKTAAAYNPAIVPTFARHPQLSMYAANAEVLASSLGLELAKFKGIRYRCVTKSKLIRKSTEGLEAYIARLSKSVKSLDIAIPSLVLNPQDIVEVHKAISKAVKSKDEATYMRNHNSCFLYYRPCEFFSRCNGCNYSAFPKLEIHSSDSVGDE